jgi:hypothetical protein
MARPTTLSTAHNRLNEYRQSLSRNTTACEQVRGAALERNQEKTMTKKRVLSVSIIVLVFFMFSMSALAQPLVEMDFVLGIHRPALAHDNLTVVGTVSRNNSGGHNDGAQMFQQILQPLTQCSC